MKELLRKFKRKLLVRLFKSELGFVAAEVRIPRHALGERPDEAAKEDLYKLVANHLKDDNELVVRRSLGVDCVIYDTKIVFLKKL